MPTPVRDIPLASHVITFCAGDSAPRIGVLVRKTSCFVYLVGSFYRPFGGWSAETLEYARRLDGVLGFIPPGISTDASRDKLKAALATACDATPVDANRFCAARQEALCAARRDALVAVLEAHNVELVK